MTDLLMYLVQLGLFGNGVCPGWQGRPPCMMHLNMNEYTGETGFLFNVLLFLYG